MKKFLIICLLLFAGASAFAESDLQFTTQALSLYQNKYITWNNRRYRESLAFEYSGNVFEVTNHNYLWHPRFGFYESLSCIVKDTFGLGLAAGSCFKVFDGESNQIVISAGLHTTFYSFNYMEFGIESDFRFKFLKNKRFSPVAGLCLSFDFLTNGTADDVVDSEVHSIFNNVTPAQETNGDTTIERTIVNDNTLDKFLAFYVMPYIAFSINF